MLAPDSESRHVARLTAWRHAAHAAACDQLTPWPHGTVVRSTRFPNYWDLNVLRVEDAPGIDVDALIAAADAGLRGLEHRRVDFDRADAGLPLREEFEARGWKTTVLVWMRHPAPLPPVGGTAPAEPVERVPYDAVDHPRHAWHEEDFPGIDSTLHHSQAREVALGRGAEVLAASRGGQPIAFAQIERVGDTAEITQVFVHPDHRGQGVGTAITRGAITALAQATDLWICADDDARPKRLYARLGFRAVARTIEFLRMP